MDANIIQLSYIEADTAIWVKDESIEHGWVTDLCVMKPKGYKIHSVCEKIARNMKTKLLHELKL